MPRVQFDDGRWESRSSRTTRLVRAAIRRAHLSVVPPEPHLDGECSGASTHTPHLKYSLPYRAPQGAELGTSPQTSQHPNGGRGPEHPDGEAKRVRQTSNGKQQRIEAYWDPSSAQQTEQPTRGEERAAQHSPACHFQGVAVEWMRARPKAAQGQTGRAGSRSS